MAKKKRRKVEGAGGPAGEGRGPEAPPRATAPAEAVPPAEPREGAPVELPGWRWHLGVFLACLAASALLLWGGYVPLMRYHSRKYMRIGDGYLAWAQRFGTDAARDEAFRRHFDALNEGLAPMGRAAREFQEAWSAYDLPATGPTDERGRRFQEKFKRFADGFEAFQSMVDRIAEETRVYEEIEGIEAFIRARAPLAAKGLRRLAETRLAMDNSNEIWTAFVDYRNYLETVVKFRNCFDRETALDEAMSAYLDAVGFGRRWTTPRMKLADLYALRGWRDMAGEEYAKVVRLDPRGAGEEALGKIRAMAEADPEVRFHLGVALLARGEYEEAARAFETLVDWAPGSLYGPKSEELARLARSGDERGIEDFLADQVFL